jgi:hypothetical protein
MKSTEPQIREPGHFRRILKVTRREDLERALGNAVDNAIADGLTEPGKGILVTRHSDELFSVELTDEVPSGTTVELDARKSRMH